MFNNITNTSLEVFSNAWCLSLFGRWKVDFKGSKINHSLSKQPILQFVSIKRKDCGEWAIPGVCLSTSFYSHFVAFTVWNSALFHCTCSFCHPSSYTLWDTSMTYMCALFVGDGRSWGAGITHSAAWVFRRGLKLVGSHGNREGKDPRTHHQTF